MNKLISSQDTRGFPMDLVSHRKKKNVSILSRFHQTCYFEQRVFEKVGEVQGEEVPRLVTYCFYDDRVWRSGREDKAQLPGALHQRSFVCQ